MARVLMQLPNLCLVLLLLLLSLGSGISLGSGGTMKFVDAQKKWCVAKPSTSDADLRDNILYACEHVDCTIIRPGNLCFKPDTLINHASVVMNLYYQAKGENPWNCYFANSGLTAVTDPSYDKCKYA